MHGKGAISMARQAYCAPAGAVSSFEVSSTAVPAVCVRRTVRVVPQARVHSHVTRRPRGRSPRRRTVAPVAEPPPSTKDEDSCSSQYRVCEAALGELYAVADVRCGAFYAAVGDGYFHPLRRREMYDALRHRVRCGTLCLVVRDRDPAPEWRPFSGSDGALVVASLDLTCHNSDGTRAELDSAPRDACLYVSSMAVREQWRRQGLATMLLWHVEAISRQCGVQKVYLHVDEENKGAVKLYSRFGYRRVRNATKWMSALAKKEHTLLFKVVEPEQQGAVARRLKQLAGVNV